jgi:tRNA(Ile)-lysidine synthase
MYSRFTEYIKTKKLFEQEEKVLLAVSGGMDSMVLLYLFEKSGYNYGVVHCNFQLRGEDSDADENFVKSQVLNHGVEFFCRRFETLEHARLNGISVEMAARELRYAYFEETGYENNYDYIATAHHLDDLAETFFLNLSRKTGIRGLTGIKEKAGKIIRPMLFSDRRDIENFARLNFIDYREDSSNSEVIFQRNFIRHRILPVFSELNPAFKSNLIETVANLREAEEVFTWSIREAMKKVVTVQENGLTIHVESLQGFPFQKILLFEILSAYNFNARVAEQVFKSLVSAPGRQFFSKTHRLVKDRNHLYISELSEKDERFYYIEEDDIELFSPLDISIEKISAAKFRLIKSPTVACLDLDKIEYPLIIRKWQKGDYFQPLGMSGFKKLSDFFIDEKIPVHEKDNAWLLCSGQKIVWVIGFRIDNRFKINQDTKNVLKIELKMR